MTLRDKGRQLEAYRRMLAIRGFDRAASKQNDDGEIPGALHTSIGQEAAIVGACMALRDDDYITGTHRSHGHPIGKGAKLGPLMAELMGKVTGVCKGRGGSMHLADTTVGIIGESGIVGGGFPLATGAALSAHVRGTDQVSLCFFGDGATNEGSFHESLNMASLWKLPAIYFCENNHYAATTPLLKSHGQPSIARRADGYGIPGVVVDGQDLDAVYDAAFTAVARARSGDGPTVIEAMTYRFDEHALGVFMPSIYRPAEEVERYKKDRDPLVLYRQALMDAGHTDADLVAVEAAVDTLISEAVDFSLKSPFPDPADVYEFMYSNPINYPDREVR